MSRRGYFLLSILLFSLGILFIICFKNEIIDFMKIDNDYNIIQNARYQIRNGHKDIAISLLRKSIKEKSNPDLLKSELVQILLDDKNDDEARIIARHCSSRFCKDVLGDLSKDCDYQLINNSLVNYILCLTDKYISTGTEYPQFCAVLEMINKIKKRDWEVKQEIERNNIIIKAIRFYIDIIKLPLNGNILTSTQRDIINKMDINEDLYDCNILEDKFKRELMNNNEYNNYVDNSIMKVMYYLQYLENEYRIVNYDYVEYNRLDKESIKIMLGICEDSASIKSVENLLKGKIKIESKDLSGYTPLLTCVSRKRRDIVKYIIKNGANINERTYNGMSALGLAIGVEDNEMFNDLIKAGLDVNGADRAGNTEIMHAIGNKYFINELIRLGANVNAKNKFGENAIHFASMQDEESEKEKLFKLDRLGSIELLIENGANINEKNYKGETPLMLASYKRNKETVRLLLNHGADITIQNNEGKDALYYAKNNELFIGLKNNKLVNMMYHSARKEPLRIEEGYGNEEVINMLISRMGSKN